MNMPGGQYHTPRPDDDANNNIRYGHIPQRVPRRNKTLKRVEYVLFLPLTDPSLTLCTQALPWQLCARLCCPDQTAQPLRIQRRARVHTYALFGRDGRS
jgi:hypothetical protein